MAQAFKCDRCGKYYSAEDDNRVNSILRGVILKRNGGVLDICPNCANSLLNWLNQGEDKENDSTTDV